MNFCKEFKITYDIWKTIQINNSSSWGSTTYKIFDVQEIYYILTGNKDFIYVSYIDSENFSDYSGSFINDSQTVISFDDAKASIIGLSSVPNLRNSKGVPITSLNTTQGEEAVKVALVPREGTEIIRASHNFCDCTTWYYESSRITGSQFYNSGDNRIFSCSHVNLIDLVHGKILNERLYDTQVTTSIWVDSDLKTEKIWEEDTGDYVVNYSSGTIEFLYDVTGSVTGDYSIANGSIWLMEPTAGKKLDIEDAEGQFSTNVLMKDTIVFEVYGYVDIFAPQLLQSNGGPYPSLTKIPIKTEYYKSFAQIIDEAKGTYPVLSPLSGARGLENFTYGFPFRYGTRRTLYSSYGMDLRVRLQNNRKYGGERATVTFYCVEDDE